MRLENLLRALTTLVMCYPSMLAMGYPFGFRRQVIDAQRRDKESINSRWRLPMAHGDDDYNQQGKRRLSEEEMQNDDDNRGGREQDNAAHA